MTVLQRKPLVLGALSFAVVGAASLALAGDPVTDIPKGHGFPADQATLERYRASEDVAAMRRHGWTLWAALSQPAASGGPVWETWEATPAVFPDPAGPESAAPPPRRFQRPRQHERPGPEAKGQALLSFVLFNPVCAAHIRAQKLNLRKTLADLNASFDSTPGTPVSARHVPAFPRESVALKLVWDVVPKAGTRVLPIWDFQPTKAVAEENDPETWRRSIVVDGTRTLIPPGETRTVTVPGPGGTPETRVCRVVSYADFYSFAVDSEPLRASAQKETGRTVALGDRAILLAMHVTTKEIGDWVWATFWWHDQPNGGPFAADRIADVAGVWRNYLMDVSFDGTTPREYDGTPNACMNPWLEARFQNGLASNCMTCHQRATHPPQSFEPVTRGLLLPDDPYFADKTATDFLWSVAYEAK